jgi:hypothetical protein
VTHTLACKTREEKENWITSIRIATKLPSYYASKIVFKTNSKQTNNKTNKQNEYSHKYIALPNKNK